jgi:thioredoxin 1
VAIVEANDSTFQKEVLQAQLPVLIDLYADWCAPCKQMAPMIEQVSQELEGKLKVVKINVDKSPLIAQSLRVQSIPTLMLIAQGQLVNQVSGAIDKPALLRFVKPVLPTDATEISPADLAELIKSKQALPVDIRDAASFLRYRIPTSINIEQSELESKEAELAPADGRLRVLYGRSTEEARAAAEGLKKKGILVGYLSGGFLHWEADGLEVERGTN